MDPECVSCEEPVTLVGGGGFSRPTLEAALSIAPALVAADGAADQLWEWGYKPRLIVGDMDSLAAPVQWPGRGVDLIHIAEQDSTDFEKALYTTVAPLYVGVGFTGRRVDHTLAVFHAMLARSQKRVILLGEAEVMALIPPGQIIEINLWPGAVVSLYPLKPAKGIHSKGLRWSIEGLAFAVGQQIGTSNLAEADHIELGVDGPGCLLMLPAKALRHLIRALGYEVNADADSI